MFGSFTPLEVIIAPLLSLLGAGEESTSTVGFMYHGPVPLSQLGVQGLPITLNECLLMAAG